MRVGRRELRQHSWVQPLSPASSFPGQLFDIGGPNKGIGRDERKQSKRSSGGSKSRGEGRKFPSGLATLRGFTSSSSAAVVVVAVVCGGEGGCSGGSS